MDKYSFLNNTKRKIGIILISIISILFFSIGLSPFPVFAKKVKQSLKIVSEPKENNENNPKESKNIIHFEACDSVYNINNNFSDCENDSIITIDSFKFAGYEKEANSSIESFILTNNSPLRIIGGEVEISYFDLKGRMLHKRIVDFECDIPKGESRKIDIKSWDKQHTYFYYRGNEPKKTATPYDVKFAAVSMNLL